MGEFEKDIRDMFADYELHIDTEEIWPDIEKRLNKDKRKKRFLWWWSAPLLLLIPAGVYFAYQHNGDTRHNRGYDESISYSINNQNKSIENTVEKGLIEENQVLKEDPSENTKQEIAAERTRRKSMNDKSSVINNVSQSEFLITTDHIAISNSGTGLNNNNNIESNKNIAEASIISNIAFIPETSKLTALIGPLFYNRNFMPVVKINEKSELAEKTDEKSQKWDKSIDLAIGFALANKFLKTRDDGFANYREKRIKTENHLEALTSSIVYNAKHRSGLFFTTGLDYCQIDEKFRDIDSLDILRSGDGLINVIIEPDGSTIEERGKKEIIEHKTWDKKIYNYYFFLDIPLSVGYAGKIKKINYEVSSGISYNIVFLKKGQIIGINQYPVDIKKESGIFKTQTGLSLISGIKVLVPYKNKMLFIAPKLKYNLQSLTNDDNPLSQKYLTYGIEIGGRIGF
jgi:hypothetical protein